MIPKENPQRERTARVLISFPTAISEFKMNSIKHIHTKISSNSRDLAAAYWRQGCPVKGTKAETYLRWWGFTLPIPNEFRFIPQCSHPAGGLATPAIVARVRNLNGEFVGSHLTFLPDDPKRIITKTLIGGELNSGVMLGDLRSQDPRLLCISQQIEDALLFQQRKGGVWLASLDHGLWDFAALPPQYDRAVIGWGLPSACPKAFDDPIMLPVGLSEHRRGLIQMCERIRGLAA